MNKPNEHSPLEDMVTNVLETQFSCFDYGGD
jgi:hypothetical protein